MRIIEADVAVIGAGSAGMAAFREAHGAGRHTLLIEGGTFGTTCARVGCMPSKLLLSVANGLHDARQLGARGVGGVGDLHAFGPHVMQFVRRERDSFVGGVLRELATFPHECVVQGKARFVPSKGATHRLAVGDDLLIDAKSVVIATGAVSSVPDAFEVFGDTLITSDTIFDLADLPARVAVFGAGPIALELGQGLARLGCTIRLFGRDNEVAGLSDRPVRDALVQTLAHEFPIDPDADVQSMTMVDGKPTIAWRGANGETITETFDAVLVATGRRPNLESLALEHAGVALDERGTPRFDEQSMQCGDSSVFIAGDCDGTRPFLADAADEGRIAGLNAAHFPDVSRVTRKVPFAIVFCEPQVATIGVPYDKLDRQNVVTGEVSFAHQGRSRVKGQAHGLLHVYADTQDGRLLGAELCGPDAEHLGHLLAWAVQLELDLDTLLALPFYHPVVEEGLRTALRDAQSKRYALRGETAPTLSSAVGC